MNRAWTLTGLLAVSFLLPPAARGWQKPRSTDLPASIPLRTTLERSKYVAVPLIQEERESAYIVECKSGSEPIRLLLDTGTEHSSLDKSFVKKLDLKQEGEAKTLGIAGLGTGVNVTLRDLVIGSFDTQAADKPLRFVATDLTEANTARRGRKLRPIDGFLGRSLLRANSAVIDFPNRTLYLRSDKSKQTERDVGSLRADLEKQGYLAIPLLQREGDAGIEVECKCGTKPFRLLLDTGSEASVLEMSLVKLIGAKLEGEVGLTNGGGLKGHEANLRGVLIGGFDTRTVVDSLYFVGIDLDSLNAELTKRKLRPIEGILGHSTLDAVSAVIDYSTRTLYVRTLLTGLWPEIKGRWVATGARQDGQELKLDPTSPSKLEFKNRRFHLIDGTSQYEFGLHINAVKDHYTMMFFDPEREFSKELVYLAGGVLKVKDGKLSVCLCLDPSKAKGLPTDFAATGPGHLFLEFRREK